MEQQNFITGKKGIVYAGRRYIQKTLGKIFPKVLMTKIYYRVHMGKKLNIEKPTTFNEKIQWYKLNYCLFDERIIKCSDKYKVREFLEEKGLGKYLNPLIGVWEKSSEIKWSDLPNKFVIKANHGCAYNLICRDKSSLKINKISKILDKWLKEDFGLLNIEPHYDLIEKKLICEEFIETDDANLPNDIKIYYFNGIPKLILVSSERENITKYKLLDLDWNILDIGASKENLSINKPKLLNEALSVGNILAEGFPFVRIDFYDCEKKVIFGEMSFTPAAGMSKNYTEQGDKIVGDMFALTKN